MELQNSPFLKVLRAGIWNLPLEESADEPLSESDWSDIFTLAKAHSVQALIVDGAGLVPAVSRPRLQQIASLALATDKIEQGNNKVEAVLQQMAAYWKKEGVTAILLKGQGLARMYAIPKHRTPGDIDWYFPGNDNFQRALALVKAKGIVPEIDGDGDYHYCVNGVVVEHHRKWCDISSPLKKRRVHFLEQEYGFSDDSDYCVLAPLTNLIQLNSHILKHLLVMGLGWRQLCDLALATRHYCGRYSIEEYRQVIKSLGLMKWTRLLYGVLAKYLGTDYAWMPVNPIEGKDTDRLAALILRSGNFGRESGRNMLGSFLSASALLIKYAPGEVLWRPFMLVWNRSSQLFRRK